MTNKELKERFKKSIPWGSSTCAKVPRLEHEPGAMLWGKGCRTYDVLGKDYIDFKCSLGPVTLGYSYEPLNQALKDQIDKGIVFSHPHIIECEVAEKLIEIIPCFEKVRFLKTGGEAAAALIRIARGYTGKKHIIQIGYNGWLNGLAIGGKSLPGVISQGTVGGVPEEISSFYHVAQWDDIEGIKNIFDVYKNDVAGIIVSADYEYMEKGSIFYKQLRNICDENSSLLIYDEIVTGFRVAQGGVDEYFNVKPDLAVYSKGIGNGMPISAYGGKKEIMDTCGEGGKVVVSSTGGGETLSLAAVNLVIDTYKKENVVDHMWKQGEKMWGSANKLFEKYDIPLSYKGFPPCMTLVGDNVVKSEFSNLAFKSGLVLYTVNYINLSHKDKDISEALERFELACKEYKGC